jgi:uncharacterized membrane protein
LRTKSLVFLVVLFGFQLTGPSPVQAHPKQVQLTGDYEITYFSDPQDPIADSQATLFIQVRNVTSGAQLRVYHFLVEMIPPDGPRLIQHPTSNSTTFTFDQPGNWILLFEIGLTANLGIFDTSATFLADISQAQTSGLLTAFFNVLLSSIPKSYKRWGHIFAVVLWLGTMLHVVNTYRSSARERTRLSNFALTYRQADFVVALAVGLLVLTGVLRAFDHGLATPPTLFESDFGLVLFAKISLAAGMIAIGLFNRTYLIRNLERAVGSSQPLAPGQVELSDKKTGVLAKRVYYLTILEMGLGVLAILFGTVFTQIHTIA